MEELPYIPPHFQKEWFDIEVLMIEKAISAA
jgi:hypothetical protein